MNYKDGLDTIPEHMRESISWWIEKGEPRVELMGHFLRAMLSNDLMEAFARADMDNAAAMRDWIAFLYNYAPYACYGSPEKLARWYDAHHPEAPGG